MNELAGLLFLSSFLEGFIVYIFGNKKDNKLREFIPYLTLFLGVILAWSYQVNIPALLDIHSPHVWASYIVSGVIIGRGSNYLNDIVGKFRKK